ncbi:MAG: outer membrane protein assembly factor BamB [Planctomycetaceae bacterium]|jgi:outer membrane protein assembly factor BamB
MNRHSIALLALLTVLAPSLTPDRSTAKAAPVLASEAAKLIEQSGIKGGLVVHIGLSDGQLTAALKANSRYQVHGIDRDIAKVNAARSALQKMGVYGEVSVGLLTGERLPYIENLVNLMVIEDRSDVSDAEFLRALTPNGVAFIRNGDDWKKVVKPRPNNIDDWSHFLHSASNNAVAQDTAVGPPRHLQWLGSPRWSRHHDRMASMSALVSAGGRLFYIMDEGSRVSIQLPPSWKLVGRDAFNGTILWKLDIPKWHSHLWPLKSGPTQLARRLVATKDEVYATLGIDAPLSAIDAETGEILRTYEDTAATEEILHDNGTLFLTVNKGESDLVKYAPINPVTGDQGDVGKNWRWNEKPVIVMSVDAKSGKTNWSRQTQVAPLTLTADAERVYLHDGEKVVCLNRTSGDLEWSSEPAARRRTITYNFGPRLVIHKGVLLYAGGERTMKAFDVKTGNVLWDAPHDRSGYQSPEDLLIVKDLVWSAPTTSGGDSGIFTARDYKTGEVKITFPPDVSAYWFHHRCYIAKATEKFIMPSRTGIEFVDTDKKSWDINHWVRGGCLYGVMPCNGLVYAPPHNCACYPEAKLYGFNALAPATVSREPPKDVPEDTRLVKGPAFGDAIKTSSVVDDWPTFRHDQARSGTSSADIPTELSRKWTTDIGGRLSAVTVAEGKLFVAQIDEHRVYALNAATGKKAWEFTAGSRVDSPPTIEDGRAYFGANDGWIYCLRATDGELVWRYLAAPEDRRLMAFEQLESVWPVHGSVLVQNGFVFGVAGRSNFLDGGLRFLKLDARTGSMVAESIIDEIDPETGKNLQMRHETLQMPVGLPDILSSDGENVYMKSQRLDQEGKRYDIGPNSGDFAGQASVHAGKHAHLFAPMGFLDDTWFHRSYWVYGKSFAGGHAGYYQAGKFAPSGRILVFDEDNVYGFGRKPDHLRWTTVLEHQLFSAPREAPVVPESAKTMRRGKASSAAMVRVPLSKKIDPTNKSVFVEAWTNVEKPQGVVVAHGGPLNGYSLFIQKGRPQFAARINEKLVQVSSKESVVGKWAKLAGAITSDGKIVLYVNGSMVSSAKVEGLIPKAPAQSIEIGADDGSAVGNYQSPHGITAVIDDVKVIHGSFTAADVEEHIESPEALTGKAVFASSFTSGKATDDSGLGNDGSIVAATAVVGRSGKALHFAGRSNAGGKSSGSFVEPHWTKDAPLFVRAMVKAGSNLFIVGPPDIVDEAETFEKLKNRDVTVDAVLAKQDALLNGSEGSLLRAVSAKDGSTISSMQLEALPIWDGMAAARGQLFLSTQDGTVICLGK